MSDTWVLSFTHLKDKPQASNAQRQLQRIASLVKPIMRKHHWKLPVLSEFFPDDPQLLGLNVNGGQKILIRLRPAHAPDTFYDEESLVRTMLHELTHNVHGPHDAKFYAYLVDLEQEYETLRRSGWDGEGFLSNGTRLGKGVSHDVPVHAARQKILDAIEKRKRAGGLSSGPQRLGGAQIGPRLTPRELAAEAALRRASDEKACGQTMADPEREAAQAAEQGVLTQAPIIDLSSDDEDVIIVDDPIPHPGSSKIAVPVPATAIAPAAKPPVKKPDFPKAEPTRTRIPPPRVQPAPALPTAEWACPSCTLVNSASESRCSICRAAKPRSIAMINTPEPGWTCPRCTLVNPNAATTCGACDGLAPIVPMPTLDSDWICLTCGADGNPKDFWSCRLCGSVKGHS